MNEWMQQHPASIGGLVLWAIGLLWLMPSGKSGKSRPQLPGVLLALPLVVVLQVFSQRVLVEQVIDRWT